MLVCPTVSDLIFFFIEVVIFVYLECNESVQLKEVIALNYFFVEMKEHL